MIGVSLMYMEPIMLLVDVSGFIINQNKLMACITTMQELDDKLQKEKITVDYRKIRKLTIRLIVMISLFESGIVAYNYVRLEDTIWFAPLYMSTVSKCWYVALVYNIKQKFDAINLHFENMRKKFDENKWKIKATNGTAKEKSSVRDHIGYLHREIVVKKSKPDLAFAVRRKNDILQIQPVVEVLGKFMYLFRIFSMVSNIFKSLSIWRNSK